MANSSYDDGGAVRLPGDEPEESAGEHNADAQIAQLTADKLRLEIKSLSRPWWQTPSSLAPIATIIGALLALFWGVVSGFFDVSRRELDIRRKEVASDLRMLEERRDQQRRQFEATAESYRNQIAALTRQVETQRTANAGMTAQAAALREKIKELDQPVITKALMRDHNQKIVHITINGFNLGLDSGTAFMSVRITCDPQEDPQPDGSLRVRTDEIGSNIPLEIFEWSTSKVELRASVSALRDVVNHLKAEIGAPTLSRCKLDVLVFLERTDRKTTNGVIVVGAEAVLRL